MAASIWLSTLRWRWTAWCTPIVLEQELSSYNLSSTSFIKLHRNMADQVSDKMVTINNWYGLSKLKIRHSRLEKIVMKEPMPPLVESNLAYSSFLIYCIFMYLLIRFIRTILLRKNIANESTPCLFSSFISDGKFNLSNRIFW